MPCSGELRGCLDGGSRCFVVGNTVPRRASEPRWKSSAYEEGGPLGGCRVAASGRRVSSPGAGVNRAASGGFSPAAGASCRGQSLLPGARVTMCWDALAVADPVLSDTPECGAGGCRVYTWGTRLSGTCPATPRLLLCSHTLPRGRLHQRL